MCRILYLNKCVILSSMRLLIKNAVSRETVVSSADSFLIYNFFIYFEQSVRKSIRAQLNIPQAYIEESRLECKKG